LTLAANTKIETTISKQTSTRSPRISTFTNSSKIKNPMKQRRKAILNTTQLKTRIQKEPIFSYQPNLSYRDQKCKKK
jgi:hypothetical protein